MDLGWGILGSDNSNEERTRSGNVLEEGLVVCREERWRTEIWPSSVPAALLMTMERMRVGMRSS